MNLNNKHFNLLDLLKQMQVNDYFQFKYNKSFINICLQHRKLKNNQIEKFFYYECDTMNEELDCKIFNSIDELINNAMVEDKNLIDICDDVELIEYSQGKQGNSQESHHEKKRLLKKEFVITLFVLAVLGFLITIILLTIINFF